MNINNLRKLHLSLLAATFLLFAASPGAEALAASQSKNTTTKQTNSRSTSRKKGGAKGASSSKESNLKKAAGSQTGNRKKSVNTGKKKTSGKRAGTSGRKKTETSADLKRQQEEAQREVKRTQAELQANERSVKVSLADLSRIESDISVSRKEMSTISSQVKTLDGQIGTLHGRIADGEAELSRLREEYIKAVKKMRVSKKKNSGLAFIFASASFNQAMRRMRYLRQFSEWKQNRTAEITGQIEQLESQRKSLSQARADRNVALQRQQQVQSRLESQKVKQDAIVSELKANGDALRSHLSKKQAEVNQLRNRVAELIALEEHKAAEERERRAAEERRQTEERRAAQAAEERRLAEERRKTDEALRAEQRAAEEAQRKAEAEALAAEKAAAELKAAAEKAKADKKAAADLKAAAAKKEAEQKKALAAKAKAEKKAAEEKAKAEKKLAEAKKENEARKKAENSKSYAEARKRTPRSENATAGAADFEKMRGRLPRPVAGNFRVTSRFGRQSLPDMPDVVYDNPGIDAEVARGSSASAVFAGTVAGVYVVPGFNNVVILRHGNYYTVYGNITSPSVKSGDNVKQGQNLGRLGDDPDNGGHGLIHFEVWKNRTKLDPSSWIQ